MKTFLVWLCRTLFAAFLGGVLWLGFHPEALIEQIAYGLLIGILFLGPILLCCAIAFPPPKPAQPSHAKPSGSAPLLAILLGALLGWWLGSSVLRDRNGGDC